MQRWVVDHSSASWQRIVPQKQFLQTLRFSPENALALLDERLLPKVAVSLPRPEAKGADNKRPNRVAGVVGNEPQPLTRSGGR